MGNLVLGGDRVIFPPFLSSCVESMGDTQNWSFWLERAWNVDKNSYLDFGISPNSDGDMTLLAIFIFQTSIRSVGV